MLDIIYVLMSVYLLVVEYSLDTYYVYIYNYGNRFSVLQKYTIFFILYYIYIKCIKIYHNLTILVIT